MSKFRTDSRGVALVLLFYIFITCGAIVISSDSALTADKPQAVSVPFIGEDLSYNISFWLFKNAASARMTFLKTAQGYEATVAAQTDGIVGFLTRHMHETMKSIMRFDHGKNRFQPVLFQEVLQQGAQERKRTVEFNYDKKAIFISYEGTGRKKTVIKKRMPDDDVDDLLSAFYNLRLGYFGEIKQNKYFVMKVWARERPSKITVLFPEQYKNADNTKCKGTYYAVLAMDKSLTNIASKKLIGWLSEDLTPLCGTVEDAYLFGDLKVQLKEKKRQID